MSLRPLFQSRLKELDQAIATVKPELESLQTVEDVRPVCSATQHLAQAALSLNTGAIANFIAGIPIPIMLSARKRLTVDLAPTMMVTFERTYGISPETLIEFARRKMIVVNVRDFDPAGDVDAQMARYEPWHPFLERLFERASGSVYFLAHLRHAVFDNLPSWDTSPAKLREVFAGSEQLAAAAASAQKLGADTEEGAEARFRGEPPSLVAVRWHWAYTHAMEAFMDTEAIDKKRELYERAILAKDDLERGRAFLELAKYLRYLHLVYSAPLSGSLGGTYNSLLEGEFEHMQAVRLGYMLHQYDYMYDGLRDFISDLQIGRVDPRLMDAIPARHQEILRYFGVEAYLRDGSTPHYEHYKDLINVEELERYVLEDDGTEDTLRRIAEYIGTLWNKPRPEIASGIVELAAMWSEVRRRRESRLSRLTQGHQTIDTPSLERLARAQSSVISTDPLAANFRLRARNPDPDPTSGNVPASMGMKGDFMRRVIGVFRIFKGPPK